MVLLEYVPILSEVAAVMTDRNASANDTTSSLVTNSNHYLNKSIKEDASSGRSSTFSDGSFMTATQRIRESSHHSSSSSSLGVSEDDDGSSNSDSELDLEAQSFSTPEEVTMLEESESSSLLLSGNDSIPVIPLDHLTLLAHKVKPLEQNPAAALDTRSTDTISPEDDDQFSVTSVQSLVSVVAELIAIPIRIMTAVIADLEQETLTAAPATVTRPDRAEFISVGILKSPIDMDALGITLETDTIEDGKKQVLVIQQIDANGPWGSSPLCTGDRLVSINHVPVSHWAPRAVEHYWGNLTDSVTLVAHNPVGDPQKVAVMITKPDPSSRTGLGMRSSRPGRIKISRVNGLFAESILSPGDQVLSINSQDVEGQRSCDTASAILQSPKFVNVVARANAQNAFVISTNQRPNQRSEEATAAALLPNINMTEEDNIQAAEGELQDTDIHLKPERELNCCDDCGGGCTTIKVLQWAGNLYVTLLLTLGLYLCFDQQLGLAFVMGVMFLSLVMANIININIRQVQRHLIEKVPLRHCGTFQMTANVIVVGAFTFVILMWRHLDYTAITMEFVVTVFLLILAPMLLFINFPSCCTRPLEDFEFEDDYDHSAVASLAPGRL